MNIVDQTEHSVDSQFSAHAPDVSRTAKGVPGINTGGERRFRNPLPGTGLFSLSGRF